MENYFSSKFPLLLAPRGEPQWAVTLGQRTWYSVPETEVSDSWRRHEDAHKAQFARDGYVKFLFLYLFDYLNGRLKGLNHHAAYMAIRYEVEARAHETP